MHFFKEEGKMIRRIRIILVCLVMLFTFGCMQQTTTGKYSVGFVTDSGGINDQSFNQSGWEGVQKAGSTLGANIKYLESKREDDYVPNLTRFAREGRTITWAAGYKLEKAIADVSSQFPKQHFGIVDSNLGGKIPKNVVAVTFKENEGSYLMGVLAGLTTKTNKVGFIGGVTSTLIKKFEAGYTAGVKSVNPNAQIKTAYAEAFDNATVGRSLARNMYNDGVDIIFHASGDTGKGLFDEVKTREKGKYWAIGVDKDQSRLAPDHTLSSMIKRVDVAIYEISKKAKENNLPLGKEIIYGFKENGIGYAESTKKHVSADVIKKLDEVKKNIVDGKITVPTTV